MKLSLFNSSAAKNTEKYTEQDKKNNSDFSASIEKVRRHGARQVMMFLNPWTLLLLPADLI